MMSIVSVFSFLILLLVISSTSCTTQKNAPEAVPSGANVGNGGDYLESLFEQGRLHATRIVEQIGETDAKLVDSSLMSQKDFEWLLMSKATVINDLNSSLHVWDKRPQFECHKDPCSCTEPLPSSPVYFRYDGCRAVQRLRQAAEILLHETAHHLLGASEERARKFAAAISALWTSWGHSETSHWVNIAPWLPLTYWRGTSDPSWTGSEIMVFETNAKGKTRTAWLNPAHNRAWRYEESANSFNMKNYSFNENAFWFSNKLVVLPAGIVFDRETKIWSEITKEGAPSGRQSTLVKKGRDMIAVWGGRPILGEALYYNDGGIFLVKENRWLSIPSAGAPKSADHTNGDWIGDSFVVWGGPHPEESKRFSLRENRWIPLSMKGAPSPRYYATVLSNGKQLFVYGGSIERGIWLTNGALYDLESNTWIPISLENSPGLPPVGNQELDRVRPLPGLWTDTHFVIVTERVNYYDPLRSKWVTRSEFSPWTDADLFWDGINLVLMNGVRGYILYP